MILGVVMECGDYCEILFSLFLSLVFQLPSHLSTALLLIRRKHSRPDIGNRYIIYHAIVTIVTNHYRPQNDMEKELIARKALTTALAQLAPPAPQG